MYKKSPHRFTRYFVTIFVCGILLAGFRSVTAQTLKENDQRNNVVDFTALDEPTSKEAVRELVSTLSDNDVRAILIERLDAV